MASMEEADRPIASAGDSSKKSPSARKDERAANDLADQFLRSLHDPLRRIALHALEKMGDDASARAWLDHRICKPLLSLIDEAQQGKQPSRAQPKASNGPPRPGGFASRPPRPSSNSHGSQPSHSSPAARAAREGAPNESAISASPLSKRTAERKSAVQHTAVQPAEDASLVALVETLKKPRSEAPKSHPEASRPPAPPSFQPLASKSQKLSGAARASSRPPPPPWRAQDSTPEAPQARPRRGESMPPAPSSRRRELETLIPPVQKSEDDLIEPLMKRLTALRFIESREEAATFLLDLAIDAVPARVGMIHFYDPGPSEYVVAAAAGERASALESWSSGDDDPLLSEALRQKKLVHITSTEKNPRVQKGRWAIVRPRHAVVCVPCHRAGRRVGAFELVDPHERSDFARNQLNALSFLAGELSKFVAEREQTASRAVGS